MQAMRVTLIAVLAGWIAGVISANLFLFIRLRLAFGTWDSPWYDRYEFLAAEFRVAWMLAACLLVLSLLVVGPLISYLLTQPRLWRPRKATLIGALPGVLGFFCVLLAGDETLARVGGRPDGLLFGAMLAVIGASIGFFGARAARSLPPSGEEIDVPATEVSPAPTGAVEGPAPEARPAEPSQGSYNY